MTDEHAWRSRWWTTDSGQQRVLAEIVALRMGISEDLVLEAMCRGLVFTLDEQDPHGVHITTEPVEAW